MGPIRPYQPVTPANNQYLARRWDHEIFNTHRKKVAAAKAMIDNDPPRVHMHLHIKLKKLQFEAERLATIERDNRILLEKMAHIMRSGGVVDNKKEDYHLKSLNKIKRQRELLRITHENLAILKRLSTKDPHYNHKKWHLQWQVNQQYLMNISKFPHPWRQEQSPYQSKAERQNMANKHINQKVLCSKNTGSRSAGGTPKPDVKPQRNAVSAVERKTTAAPKTNGKASIAKSNGYSSTAKANGTATSSKASNKASSAKPNTKSTSAKLNGKSTVAKSNAKATTEKTCNKAASAKTTDITKSAETEIKPPVNVTVTHDTEVEIKPVVAVEVTSATEMDGTMNSESTTVPTIEVTVDSCD